MTDFKITFNTFKLFVNANQDLKSKDDIKKAIKEAFPALKGNTGGSLLRALATAAYSIPNIPKAEGLNTLKPLYKLYKTAYPLLNSLTSNLVKLRKIIKIHNKHFWVESRHREYFNITISDKKQRKDTSDAKVKKANTSLLYLDEKVLLPKIRSLQFSSDKADKVILAIAASGSRPSEVMFRSTYKPKGDDITQTGIAKKRGDTKASRQYKPLFLDNKQLINAVRDIRADYKKLKVQKVDKDTKEIVLNPSINTAINKRFKKLFPALVKQLNTRGISNKLSILRKIFITLNYIKFGRGSNFMTHSKSILAHTDMNTTESYSFVRFKGLPLDAPQQDVKAQPVQETKLNASVERRLMSLEQQISKLLQLWTAHEAQHKANPAPTIPAQELKQSLVDIKSQVLGTPPVLTRKQKNKRLRDAKMQQAYEAFTRANPDSLMSVRQLKTMASVGTEFARVFLANK